MIWTVLYMILFELLIVLSVCAMLFLSGQCSKKNCSFSLRKHEEPNIQAFFDVSSYKQKGDCECKSLLRFEYFCMMCAYNR